ncbi:MAG: hypothetical protein N2C14_03140, partial [Planctomycetales bacterium]
SEYADPGQPNQYADQNQYAGQDQNAESGPTHWENQPSAEYPPEQDEYDPADPAYQPETEVGVSDPDYQDQHDTETLTEETPSSLDREQTFAGQEDEEEEYSQDYSMDYSEDAKQGPPRWLLPAAGGSFVVLALIAAVVGIVVIGPAGGETSSSAKNSEPLNGETGDKESGDYFKWVNNQIVLSGKYRGGKKHGPWLEYNEPGQLLKRENYEQDVKEGEAALVFPNGQIQESGNYKAGKKNGPWIRFDESGIPQIEQDYLDDEPGKIIRQWNKDGKLLPMPATASKKTAASAS